MILGVGTDIIEIKRIQSAVQRHNKKFLNLIFTSAEQSYCYARKDPFPSLAARFAAKEAVAKALGTGFVNISWLDIEISNNSDGRPYVIFSEKLIRLFNLDISTQLSLSMSHSRDYATAVAVLHRAAKIM